MSRTLWKLTRAGAAVAALVAGTASAAPQPDLLPPAEVERAVLEAYPDLRAALAAVDAAEGELRDARRLPDLAVELGGNLVEERTGSRRETTTAFGVEWEVPLPWRYRAATGLARQGVAVARADAGLVETAVRSRVRGLLTELAAAQERVALLGHQRRLTADLVELITFRVEAGEGRELDRLRGVVELGQIDRALTVATAEAEALSTTLVRLSGGVLPAGLQLDLTLPTATPAVAPAAVADVAVAANPHIAVAESRLRQAEAAVAVTASGRSPTVVARAGRDSDLDVRTTSLTVAVKVPLWNANRGAVAGARAERLRAAALLEGARRDIAARAEAAARRYLAAREAARRSADELLPAARESLDLAEFSYRQGEASLLEALDARRAYQESAIQDLELRRDVHRLRVELEALTGGDLAALPTTTLPTEGDSHD